MMIVIAIILSCLSCSVALKYSNAPKLLHGRDIKQRNSLFRPATTCFSCLDSAHELSSVLLASSLGSYENIWQVSLNKALDGGLAGAAAAAVQVLSLMWLRTAINYQYRYGGDLQSALRTLYKEGGVGRLYQGLPFALAQGPLARFGDTAANAVGLVLLDALDPSQVAVPLVLRTGFGSLLAGLWRIFIMPLDNAKTTLQVNGPTGLAELSVRIQKEGPLVLYNGALASSVATFVGHYPWFLTYNYLSTALPSASSSIVLLSDVVAQYAHVDVTHLLDDRVLELLRSAFIGLCATSLSDVSTNSIRVLKTQRQTRGDMTNYVQLARSLVQVDGWKGLLTRGLGSKVLGNAVQGMLFSVVFKYLQSHPLGG